MYIATTFTNDRSDKDFLGTAVICVSQDFDHTIKKLSDEIGDDMEVRCSSLFLHEEGAEEDTEIDIRDIPEILKTAFANGEKSVDFYIPGINYENVYTVIKTPEV